MSPAPAFAHPGAHPPGRPAVVMGGSGRVQTYGELDAAANRVSRLLRAAGLGVGDHVALCVENHPDFLALAWGAHYAGVLYTACSTRLTAGELAYVVDDSGARVLVLSARQAAKAAAVDAATPKVELRLSLGGAIPGYEPLEAAAAAQPATPLAGRRAGSDMLYSSGTTGRPKGIRPKAAHLPLEESPIIITPVLRDVLGFGPGDVYLSPAPLYHAAPLRFCMGVHQLGGTVVVMERFDPAGLLDLVAAHRVTHAQLVPTMFVRLLRLPAEVRAGADVASLRAVVHAAAPCPPEVKRQMLDWWGPIVHEYYSATEGSGLTWVTSEEWLAHPGTVGRAVIGVAHVVGSGGEELGPGRTGRVFFSGGPQFEYHGDPERTRAAHDARGWATFGDIGHLDDEGYLFLTDRASYTIISGGVNVYPQEAEDVLLAHPAVLDAAVFGIPDEDLGEAVQAVVQPVAMPSSGAAADALERELIAFCRERLADVKCPRAVDLRAELPRHETGKLYKRLLKEEYARR